MFTEWVHEKLTCKLCLLNITPNFANDVGHKSGSVVQCQFHLESLFYQHFINCVYITLKQLAIAPLARFKQFILLKCNCIK